MGSSLSADGVQPELQDQYSRWILAGQRRLDVGLKREPNAGGNVAGLLNAQRRVQLGVVSLSDPLLCPVGTLAHGNYGDYFLLHSLWCEHPVKG